MSHLLTLSSLIIDNVWVSNIWIKDVNHKNAYTGDLFMVVKACVGSTTLFGWADDRKMVHLHITDSPNNSLTSLLALPKLKSPVCK